MKKMIMACLLLLTLTLVSCDTPVEAGMDTLLMSGFELINENNYVIEVRNKETGVHYYKYTIGNIGGLSPVYESDGSVRVTNK